MARVEAKDLSVRSLGKSLLRTGQTMRRIVGEQEWWDKLKLSWEKLTTDSRLIYERIRYEDGYKVGFGLYFQPLPTFTCSSPSTERGKEKLQEAVGSFSKKGQGNIEEIERAFPEGKGEISEDPSGDEARREVTDPIIHSPVGDELTTTLVAAEQEGTEVLQMFESSSVTEWDKEKQQEAVGSLSRKDKGKLKEIESYSPEGDGERMTSAGFSSDKAVREEIGPIIHTPVGDETSPLVIARDRGIESRQKDEDSPLDGHDGGNPHEGTVSFGKIMDKDTFERGAGSLSREEGTSKLQTVEKSISEEGDSSLTNYAAQTLQADGFSSKALDTEKLENNMDCLVYVEEQENTLSTIRQCLQDGVGVIGIQGVDGIGKTTLLKRLHSELCSKQDSGFDVVIMVTISKCFHHKKKIQKEIGEQLELSLLACGPSFLEEMQAAILRQALSKKKFLLILDGAQKMNWDSIGIPLPDNIHRRQIIFATNVCKDKKDVKVVEVKSLNVRTMTFILKNWYNISLGKDSCMVTSIVLTTLATLSSNILSQHLCLRMVVIQKMR